MKMKLAVAAALLMMPFAASADVTRHLSVRPEAAVADSPAQVVPLITLDGTWHEVSIDAGFPTKIVMCEEKRDTESTNYILHCVVNQEGKAKQFSVPLTFSRSI